VRSVSRISISPVKGLALVHPDEVQLQHTGVLENRRFHIVDTDGRRYNQLRKGGLVQITQATTRNGNGSRSRFRTGASPRAMSRSATT